MIKVWIVSLLSFLAALAADACNVNDSLQATSKLQFRGYMKYLHQISYEDRLDELLTNNLIHNRMRLQWNPLPILRLRADIRNRIFYGEQIRLTPNYVSMLENSNDYLDLTNAWYNNGAIVAQSTIDRLYGNLRLTHWEISLGRQRINWGISTIWTPNDIFNTYNFFDFDYEERPGSDALVLRYTPAQFSSIEWAFKPGRSRSNHIGAMLYRMNIWNYDIQAFAGILNADLTCGIGWAGNIANVGCKGEFTALHPIESISPENTSNLIGTVSLDYAWKSGWYGGATYLYNHTGSNRFTSITEFYATQVSLRTLMPFRHSAGIMINKSITPLLMAGSALIYSNASHAIIAIPTLSYSPADNWEIFLTAQLFNAQQERKYTSIANTIFMRLKYDY